jgi:hypothetical protein
VVQHHYRDFNYVTGAVGPLGQMPAVPLFIEKSIRSRCAEVVAASYFFLPDPNDGCHPAAAPFWLGAAAIVLIFSLFGSFGHDILLAMLVGNEGSCVLVESDCANKWPAQINGAHR